MTDVISKTPEHRSRASRAVYSIGLGALAAVVAGLVDRLIADDDVSLLGAVVYGALMAAFFFSASSLQLWRGHAGEE